MANAMDYIAWRADLSFMQAPINEVDCFLLSQLSTPDYTGIADHGPVTIREAAELYFQSHTEDVSNLGVLQSTGVLPMLRMAAGTPRFGEVTIEEYVNLVAPEKDEQFSAVTLNLPDGTRVIAYRGTDDTIVGWKEDFHIAIREPVPAQQDAAAYLTRMGTGFCGDLLLVGHSKGGNLAVWAAANAPEEVQEKIRSVYSFDGPGFMDPFLQSEGYLAVKDRITTVMSQHSVVGVLLKCAGKTEIVRSRISGPMAHDGFQWEVMGPKFENMTELSPASRAYEKAADDMIFGMERADLEAFMEEFFAAIETSGVSTLAEFNAMKAPAKLEVLKALYRGKRVNEFAVEFLEKMIRALFGAAAAQGKEN